MARETATDAGTPEQDTAWAELGRELRALAGELTAQTRPDGTPAYTDDEVAHIVALAAAGRLP